MARFRYQILEAYFDALADPDEGFQYTNAVFLRNVNPIKDVDFVKTDTRVENQVYYKPKIKNKIVIGNADFQFFYSEISLCKKYWCNVFKKCSAGETFIYRCFFTQLNITYNVDRCTAEIELEASTVYDCMETNKNNKTYQFISALTDQISGPGIGYYIGDPRSFIVSDLFVIVRSVLANVKCRGYENDERIFAYSPVSDFFNWQKTGTFTGYIEDTTSVIQDVSGAFGLLTPITNYVNPLDNPYYIAIAFKSNILNTSASNPQDLFEMSFSDVETIMREVFNVYWILEAGSFVRFEHYSWFSQNVNYNCTNATNFPFNKLKNQFGIEKTEHPYSETYKFGDASGTDFKGLPIIYPACSNGKRVERGAPKITTDIDYITNNAAIDITTATGQYVLFDLYWDAGTTRWYPRHATGEISAVSEKNRRLSWANLHYNLHRHNRPFKTGIMNGSSETFIGPVYKREQENMIVKMCCEDAFKKEESLVKTELGNGLIVESEANFSKETIKFKLKHD